MARFKVYAAKLSRMAERNPKTEMRNTAWRIAERRIPYGRARAVPEPGSPGQILKRELSGSAVLEVVLLIACAVGLVLIFKTQLTTLLATVFSQIESTASSIY